MGMEKSCRPEWPAVDGLGWGTEKGRPLRGVGVGGGNQIRDGKIAGTFFYHYCFWEKKNDFWKLVYGPFISSGEWSLGRWGK